MLKFLVAHYTRTRFFNVFLQYWSSTWKVNFLISFCTFWVCEWRWVTNLLSKNNSIGILLHTKISLLRVSLQKTPSIQSFCFFSVSVKHQLFNSTQVYFLELIKSNHDPFLYFCTLVFILLCSCYKLSSLKQFYMN